MNQKPRTVVYEFVCRQVELVFVGSCRNAEDETRVKDMQDLCKHLSLENNVVFKVNVSYEELQKELQEGYIGLHAMWNEHFGISKLQNSFRLIKVLFLNYNFCRCCGIHGSWVSNGGT